MNKISQREARMLRRRVKQLEDDHRLRVNRWATHYPGGVHVLTASTTIEQRAALKVVEALGHAIVGRLDENYNLKLFAVKQS